LGQLNLQNLDLLVIETDSNALSPVEFDLGHHLRVSVFSVAGGDDKATECPFLVAGSDVVLLTKTDLLPYVTFDQQVFRQDVKRLKPSLNIINASAHSNQGIEAWVGWVQAHLFRGVQSRKNEMVPSCAEPGRSKENCKRGKTKETPPDPDQPSADAPVR
jgi:hydrogenase nickel incorporation protein HypB